MYKLRVITTVQQLDHDGRVLFSAADTIDESTIDEKRNRVDVPAAFARAHGDLGMRIADVLHARYDKRGRA